MNHTVSRCSNATRRPLGYIARAAGVATAVLVSSCMTAPQSGPASTPSTPLAKSVAAPPNQGNASALSYGAVTAAVTKGKTTQMELVQMFGGPNISTMDGDGVETWVYERSVSQTDVASKSQNWQAAANLGIAFGHVQAGGNVGGGQSEGAASTASSFRSLTAIVKFNSDKTVKDYSVRASQF
ncbi:MAG: hypothetical protein M3Q00_00550 [Pseudomonadota bacterium]|nr:hypothetical protein [Pseudomonadota bacterium]